MATDKSLPKKIAVLMGGPGSERDVSLATGRGVSKALRSLGAEVVDVDVRDEKFALPKDVDLAFITIHGTFGERKISRAQRRDSGMGSRRSRSASNDFDSASGQGGAARLYRWRSDCKRRERA